MAKTNFMQRLSRHLKGRRHSYVPSTMTFAPLDPEEIKQDRKLLERGEERGQQERPPTDSDGFDDVESEVIALVDHERNTAGNVLNDEFATYAHRLAALDLDTAASDITIEARKVKSEFETELRRAASEVFNARLHLVGLENELRKFQIHHELDRTADYPESRLLHWGALCVMLLVEALLNGFFLGETHIFGLAGGITEAIIIAFVNVALGSVAGALFLRQCWHQSLFRKFFGALGLVLYLAIILTFNLAVAHYRDLLSAGHWDVATTMVLPALLQNPLGVTDLKSWMLFLVGVSFSLAAMFDGFKMDDPYPRYGRLSRKLDNARTDYASISAACLEDLTAIKDEAVEAMRFTRQELTSERAEFARILESRQGLYAKYRDHLDHLELLANTLLAAYREANLGARETVPPARFKQRWTLNRPTSPVFGELDQRKIEEAVRRANQALELEIDEVHTAYDKAIRTFKTIEELNEAELVSGSAQAIIKAA